MSTVRIVIVGDEVLNGDVQDQNIHFLARRLHALGTRVRSVAVIPDEDQVIVDTLQAGLSGGDRLLVTGGIGPTHDDRTRPSVARALELPLESHVEAEDRLRRSYGDRLTPAELLMAHLPRGSRLIVGRVSGVYGFQAGPIFVFPGVPELLRDIFETVAPEFAGATIHRHEIVSRVREGDFAEPLAVIQARFPEVAIGSYPVRDAQGWFVRLTLKSTDARRLAEAVRAVQELFAAG